MSLTAGTGVNGTISTCNTQSNCFVGRFLGSLSTLPTQQVIWNYTCLTSYDQTTHETFTLSQSSGMQAQVPNMGFQWV